MIVARGDLVWPCGMSFIYNDIADHCWFCEQSCAGKVRSPLSKLLPDERCTKRCGGAGERHGEAPRHAGPAPLGSAQESSPKGVDTPERSLYPVSSRRR